MTSQDFPYELTRAGVVMRPDADEPYEVEGVLKEQLSDRSGTMPQFDSYMPASTLPAPHHPESRPPLGFEEAVTNGQTRSTATDPLWLERLSPIDGDDLDVNKPVVSTLYR